MSVITRQLNIQDAGIKDDIVPIDGLGIFYIPKIFDVSRFSSWSIMFKADAVVGSVDVEIWSSHIDSPDPQNADDWVVIKRFSLNADTKNTLVEWENASHRWLAYRITAQFGELLEGNLYFKGNGEF